MKLICLKCGTESEINEIRGILRCSYCGEPITLISKKEENEQTTNN